MKFSVGEVVFVGFFLLGHSALPAYQVERIVVPAPGAVEDGCYDLVNQQLLLAVKGPPITGVIAMKDGSKITIAGNAASGTAGVANGPATSATLGHPHGVWSDTVGNIFISDRGIYRILKVSPDGQISNYAGNGVKGSIGDNGPATSASIFDPIQIGGDKVGNLALADGYGNRLRQVFNGVISTVAGGGLLTADGSFATSAQVGTPLGVSYSSNGDLFYSEAGPLKNIKKVSKSTKQITTVASGGSISATVNGVPSLSLSLKGPWGIWFDSKDNLFIADRNDNSIVALTKDSNHQVSFKILVPDPNSPVGISGNTDSVYIINYSNNVDILRDKSLSRSPSSSPIYIPTTVPSANPTASPSISPSAVPSSVPSANPTVSPSISPSAVPSSVPSANPTASPSISPSAVPSSVPSANPTASPSMSPSAVPSSVPSANPTASPSMSPSAVPSSVPSCTPSAVPSTLPSLAVPEYSLTISAKSFKYFEVRVFTEANERVFPVSYDLVDCPENAGAVIWGHESTPITEDTNTCVHGLPRHYWCECPALVNGNKPKLTLNFGGTVFDRVELLILDWVDGEVVVSDSANNIVLFSASRAGGPLAGEEFVGYDHLNLLQVAPSVLPTVTPSSVPTTKPSWTPTTRPSIPSIVPTQTPTMVPTTTQPSAEPSVVPSMVPSAAPSFTAQYTITLTAKTFKYFEVRVYTHDNLRIFPVSYELEHCPENAGVAVWNEQTTEDTNTCVYGYPRNFWCQCAAVADAKPKLVLHMGHTVFDRVELLLLNWEDGEVTVTDEANHETFLSATHDGVGNEFVTFGKLNLEHAVAPVRRLLRGG